METDAWHQWVLLRPLFAFLLACPFLILPLLISWLRERRDAKRQRGNELVSLQRYGKDVGDRGCEVPWFLKVAESDKPRAKPEIHVNGRPPSFHWLERKQAIPLPGPRRG